MNINWNHVDYANARRFLEIMKQWAGDMGLTQADIEDQERIVADCKATLEASEEA